MVRSEESHCEFHTGNCKTNPPLELLSHTFPFIFGRDFSVPLRQWDHATLFQWLEEYVQIPISAHGKRGLLDGEQILKATSEDLEKV